MRPRITNVAIDTCGASDAGAMRSRRHAGTAVRRPRAGAPSRSARGVAEPRAACGTRLSPARDPIHAVLAYDGEHYVAGCLEVAVVTRGSTADGTLADPEQAVGLHPEGQDRRSSG